MPPGVSRAGAKGGGLPPLEPWLVLLPNLPPLPDPLLLAGKEGHPREAKIVSIHEDILDKQVGAAAMLWV